MPDNQDNAVINLLTSITRDTGQIKTDLAVNTTRTGGIEEHLRTLNGKVVKQEERLQKVSEENDLNTRFREEAENNKRRKHDRLYDLLEKALWAIIPGIAIGLWQIIQYLIKQDVFK